MTFKNTIIFTLVCLGAFLPSLLLAAIPINNISSESAYPIDIYFEYYLNEQSQQGIEDLILLPDNNWENISSQQASFGFNTATLWLRTSITNESSTVKNFIVEVDYTQLDYVTFYRVENNNIASKFETGDMRLFYPRQIDHPSNLFHYQLAPTDTLSVYIKIQTEGSLIAPVKLWEAQDFFEAAAIEQKFHFFYYGALVFIILINLAVFITLRERLYFYYTAAISGYFIFFTTSRGHFQQLITSDLPDLSSRLFLISMPLLALFSILFAREFLKTAKHSPKLDIALKGMIVFEIFNLLIAFIASYDTVVRVSAVGAVLLFSVLFVTGPITWLSNKRPALFFTIAWTPLTVGFFATSGRTSGFLPNTFITEYAMQIGSGMEAVVLTLALADRLFRERSKKIEAQAASIEVERQRSTAQKLLTEAMSRDPISKLFNRNRFELLVQRTIDTHPTTRYIVAVAQISRLDDVTRTLGLSSAEKIIRHIADVLNKEHTKLDGVISRLNDQGKQECVYQLSKDVFGSFMSLESFEKDPKAFYDTLKRIAKPIEIEGLRIDLAPLYGCSIYPQHGSEPAQLIRNALIALGESKNAKEMMGVFHDDLDIYDEDRLTLVTQLREALLQKDLSLYYQPKFDVATNKVVGMEALARWVHPSKGFISPDEFIPLAEESGLINQLTLWAIEQAVIDTKILKQNDFSGPVSINISARDLLKMSFVDDVKNILNKHSAVAEQIYLELTETAAMENPNVSIATLTELSELGIRISVDDFGTGYSSLSYLQRLPATEVKLDRSLIFEIRKSNSAAIIIKASIDMAHALGYEIVAEGVEDTTTLERLQEYKCNIYQGYLTCKPLPLNEICEWFAKQ